MAKKQTVSMWYKGSGINMKKETRAKQIAKAHNAVFIGSGYGFGQRDIDWEIIGEKANAFRDALRRAGFGAEIF